MYYLQFERATGGIFQTANICPELNKATKHKLAGRNRQHACCCHKNV